MGYPDLQEIIIDLPVEVKVRVEVAGGEGWGGDSTSWVRRDIGWRCPEVVDRPVYLWYHGSDSTLTPGIARTLSPSGFRLGNYPKKL
jgi:hypothetical protein